MRGKNHEHAMQLPNNGLDGLGVLLSTLCLVHCIATPLLATLLPFTLWFQDEHGFHLWLAVILLPLGSVAFWRGYKKHSRLPVLLGGIFGIALLLTGVLVHGGHDDSIASQTSLISFTFLGSLLLVFSHWKNWQYSRCVDCHQPTLEIRPPRPGDQTACASANDPEHRHSQA